MAARSALWNFNPWWADKARIDEDAQIVKVRESHMRYDPPLRGQIRYEYESGNSVIYTLRGTRQVGKTTLIKLQIREFLETGTHPWNIFYYSFDMTGSRSEMAEIIQEYLLASRDKRRGRAYMFLDEITSVPEWQKGIKWLVDTGQLPDCTVLAAGSRAQSILRATERLPGRRGLTEDAYDRLLSPMRFSEFVCATDPTIAGFFSERDMASADKRHGALREILSGGAPDIVDEIHGRFGSDLQSHLESYMLSGGIPGIVDEMVRTGRIGRGTYAAYRDGITSDWGRRGHALEQLGEAIADSTGSAVSWDGLRRRAGLGGWEPTRSGALSLEDLSVAAVIYKRGERKNTLRLSGPKKIYFRDPFYMHLLGPRPDHADPFGQSELAAGDPAWAARIVEGMVADHLIRLAGDTASNPQRFSYSRRVFFWSDRKGREVDFVFYKDGEFEVPIGVKYRNRVDRRELGGIAGFAGSCRGLVLSKDELDQRRDYALVPAAEFLALV